MIGLLVPFTVTLDYMGKCLKKGYHVVLQDKSIAFRECNLTAD